MGPYLIYHGNEGKSILVAVINMSDPTRNPNMQFLHRLSKQNPIKILLSERDKPDEPAPKPQQDLHGPLLPDRRKKIRRPLQLQGIEFYDLGLLANGTTLPFNAKPDVNITHFPITNTVGFVFDDFELSHHQALWAMIMSEADNDPTKLADTFKRIEGPEHGIIVYQGRGAILVDSRNLSQINRLFNSGSNVDTDNPEWKTSKKSLKSLDDGILFVNYGGASYYFDTGNSKYKATTEFDFDATDYGIGNINFKKGTKIFLIPKVGFLRMAQRLQDGADSTHRQCYLFGHWAIRPREIFLPKTIYKGDSYNPEELRFDIPVFEGYPATDHAMMSHDVDMYDIQYMSDARTLALADYIKSLPEAELYVRRDEGMSATYGYESLSNFPFASSGKLQDYVQVTYSDNFLAETTVYGEFGGWEVLGDEGEMYRKEGLLLAIVQQGSTFYYIWWAPPTEEDIEMTWNGAEFKSPPEFP